MTEHLSTELIKRFQQQSLIAPERTLVRNHLMVCTQCRHVTIDDQIASSAVAVLTSELVNDEPYHLEYEIVEGYVEETLDASDRRIADIHLSKCSECSQEAKDLSDSLATMTAASINQYDEKPKPLAPFWTMAIPSLIPQSIRIPAIIALAVLAVVTAVVVFRARSVSTPAPKEIQFAGPLPTPNESPNNAEAVNSPTPDINRRAPKGIKLSNESTREVISLVDGPHSIVLDSSGHLHGLETLPPEAQQAVVNALVAQRIKRPDVLDELEAPSVSTRGPSENTDSPKILYPGNRVITEQLPVFLWEPTRAATGYRVEIGNNHFQSVANSDVLPSSSHSWSPSTPLKRGQMYTFVIRTFKEGNQSGSITAPKSFKVLDEHSMKELTRIKATSKSHLALGVFYARVGMTTEAALEFEKLAQENPRITLPKKLLITVQSWR